MTDVIPATDGQVEGWRNGALLLHPEGAHNPETLTGRMLAMAARIDAEKAARAEAEAERDALRERLTLTDEDARWCEMVASDTRALVGLHAGSIEAALRDHLLSALALIDRLTGEATNG